ncbi:MAG: hypothetical protein V1735_00845 [Nanoarchaeota archaeon]
MPALRMRHLGGICILMLILPFFITLPSEAAEDSIFGWTGQVASGDELDVEENPDVCMNARCVRMDLEAVSESTYLEQEVPNLLAGDYEVSTFVKGNAQMRVFWDATQFNVDSAQTTNWEQLTKTVTLNAAGNIKIRLLGKAVGDTFFDNAQIVSIDHEVPDHIPFLNASLGYSTTGPTDYPYGCCVPGTCWDGAECVSLSDPTTAYPQPVPYCVGDETSASWRLGYNRTAQQGLSDYGYCIDDQSCYWQDQNPAEPDDSSCFVESGIEGDDSCQDLPPPDWTSRQAMIAADLIKLADEQLDIEDYALLCDNADCFDSLDDETCIENGFAVSCVLLADEGWIAGSYADIGGFDYSSFDCMYNEIGNPIPACFLDRIGLIGPGSSALNNELFFLFPTPSGDTFVNGIPYNRRIGDDYISDHRIKSIGYSEKYNIVLYSSFEPNEVDYSRLEGNADFSFLRDLFSSLKTYIEDPALIPGEWERDEGDFNIDRMVSRTTDYDTLFRMKKGDKRVEAIIENLDNPFLYQFIRYEGVAANDVCANYLNLYKGNYETDPDYQDYRDYFECWNDQGTHNNNLFGKFEQMNEAPLFGGEEYPSPRYVLHETWHDMTSTIRKMAVCTYDNTYNFSRVPEAISAGIEEKESVLFNNSFSVGCCAHNGCWNGSVCVDSQDSKYFGDTEYLCYYGSWTTDMDWDWKHDQAYSCVEDTECYCPEGFPGCPTNVDNDCVTAGTYAFPDDHICLNDGDESLWTTRTALISETFRRSFPAQLAAEDFTLHCDDYNKVFPDAGAVQLPGIFPWSDTVQKACVMHYGDQTAFGLAMRHDFPLTDLNYVITNLTNTSFVDACSNVNEGDGLKGCQAIYTSPNPEFWYDSQLRLLFFNRYGMQLDTGGDWWETFIEFLQDPFRRILWWINDLFHPSPQHRVPQNFDKYYEAYFPGRAAKGAMQTQSVDPLKEGSVWYGGFTDNITEAINRYKIENPPAHLDINADARTLENQNHYFVILTRLGINYWTNLTSGLRIVPGSGDTPVPPQRD